jgi:hypothetical protein
MSLKDKRMARLSMTGLLLVVLETLYAVHKFIDVGQ